MDGGRIGVCSGVGVKEIVEKVPDFDGGSSSSCVSAKSVIYFAGFIVASSWIEDCGLFLTVVWPYRTCVRN